MYEIFPCEVVHEMELIAWINNLVCSTWPYRITIEEHDPDMPFLRVVLMDGDLHFRGSLHSRYVVARLPVGALYRIGPTIARIRHLLLESQ